MQVCARLSAVLSLVLSPVAVLADPADRHERDLSFSTGEAGSTETAPQREEVREEPRREPVEFAFCGGGGGEMSPLDEVQSLIDEGRPAMARAKLGQVLRDGLEEHERARAFAMAGEIALRLGNAPRAVAWYGQAVALSEREGIPDPMLDLGYSVALLRSGRKADAARTALALAGEECSDENGNFDSIVCYGAHLVAGLASRADVRDAELARARAIRTEAPELDETFVDFHRLLPNPRAAVLRLAAVRAD